MAKKTTATTEGTAEKKAKKPSTRKPKYFFAKIDGDSDPVMILARNAKVALAAIVTLREMTPDDLLNAGRAGYRRIDTVTPILQAVDRQEEAA